MTAAWRIPLAMRPGAATAWADAVPRWKRFQKAHPDVTILPPAAGGYRWLALIDDFLEAGKRWSITVTRYELADLLDALEKLFPP